MRTRKFQFANDRLLDMPRPVLAVRAAVPGPAPPAPVHPVRARVSRSVDRGTWKVRHTLALLAPPSSAAVICSSFSAPIVGGRPPLRPRQCAAAKPADTRSLVKARS
jgi:hypothetical protein